MADKEFEQYARECMRLACETKDEETREELIEMARMWMGKVMDDEAKEAAAVLPRGGPGAQPAR
jgi:hypothetical protein